jgi:hypothetical protein
MIPCVVGLCQWFTLANKNPGIGKLPFTPVVVTVPDAPFVPSLPRATGDVACPEVTLFCAGSLIVPVYEVVCAWTRTANVKTENRRKNFFIGRYLIERGTWCQGNSGAH